MAARKPTKRRVVKNTPKVCAFCEAEKMPDYKDFKELANFITDRAKILGKDYTGFCSKHQRRFTIAVKRARHLGLLPFSASTR